MSSKLQEEAAFQSGVRGFLSRQFCVHRVPLPPGTSLDGQTAIISGSNAGLGFEAARQLVGLNLGTLIMAVRTPSKGEEAATTLRQEFPKAQIEVWTLDMEDYESITAFAKKCETLPRIDIVLLNAGMQNATFKITTATKHEQTIQVNYISTALLTILLLPVLKSKRPSPSKPALISVVTSDTAYFAKLEAQGPVLPQFDEPESYSMNKSYPGSKLLVQFFISKLAEEISADDVIINMVNPGLCAGTSLSRDQTSWVVANIFTGIKNVVGRSTQDGASTYVDAIVVKGKESHGSYCADWKIQPYPPLLYTKDGEEIKERLWKETMEELSFANVTNIVQDMRR